MHMLRLKVQFVARVIYRRLSQPVTQTCFLAFMLIGVNTAHSPAHVVGAFAGCATLKHYLQKTEC